MDQSITPKSRLECERRKHHYTNNWKAGVKSLGFHSREKSMAAIDKYGSGIDVRKHLDEDGSEENVPRKIVA